ncbi:MAG TPA: hypothetical protein VK929_15565 [Longimicrobiales bacterium]|nr:hypothetical protein [Longimicrobiales bacterium]
MNTVHLMAWGTTALLLATSAPVVAQSSGQAGDTAGASASASASASEPRLVFEREVFQYGGRNRRDPFTPLTSSAEGPLFSDVTLHMIIYTDDPRESIVSLSVAGGRRMRLRRGETVGNATVINIGQTHVVFSVNDFGMRRQEVLYLKPPREGA